MLDGHVHAASSDNVRRATTGMAAALEESVEFREFQRAFEQMSQLPLRLVSPDVLGLAHRGSSHENGFCALMAANNRTCSNCLECQRVLRERAQATAVSVTCPAGLIESAVPVRNGERTVAFLHVGQVMHRAPTVARFDRVLRGLVGQGVTADPQPLRAAYLATRVVEPKRYHAMVRIIEIFSDQLAAMSNRLVIASQLVELPLVTRAKNYIAAKLDENMTLGQVARAMNTSSCYFCKIFRRSTGLNFLDYIGRLRVERVRRVLLDPRVRVGEAAYMAGFRSLSQFNRTFRRVVGQSPRTWRGCQGRVA
jgi:AraC-like DNA-binding protein